MENNSLPFDLPGALSINHARCEALDWILARCRGGRPFQTALDLGTGMGTFAGHLQARHGFRVKAVDVRSENIDAARRRHPQVEFSLGNIEDPRIVELGLFDLVTCFGLMYHLENPLLAMRHACRLAGRILILESMLAPGRSTQARLVDEHEGLDQGVRYLALHLSEGALVKIIYRSEMAHVYRPRFEVRHGEFRGHLIKRRMRTLLVASRRELDPDAFTRLEEPYYQVDRPYGCRALPRWILKKVKRCIRGHE